MRLIGTNKHKVAPMVGEIARVLGLVLIMGRKVLRRNIAERPLRQVAPAHRADLVR